MASVWDSVAQGRDLVRDAQQNQLMRQAGGAFAGGDYGRASNILARGGDIGGAAKVAGYGQELAQAPQQEQAEKAKQSLALLKDMATGLSRIPAAQRFPAAQAYAQRLQSIGIPAEHLATMTAEDFTDENLALFGQQVEDAWQIIQGRDGQLDRVNKGTGELQELRAGVPEPERASTPSGMIRSPDGQLSWEPGYVEAQRQLSNTRREAVVSRPMPSRARAGGAGRSGSSYNPATIKWD